MVPEKTPAICAFSNIDVRVSDGGKRDLAKHVTTLIGMKRMNVDLANKTTFKLKNSKHCDVNKLSFHHKSGGILETDAKIESSKTMNYAISILKYLLAQRASI